MKRAGGGQNVKASLAEDKLDDKNRTDKSLCVIKK